MLPVIALCVLTLSASEPPPAREEAASIAERSPRPFELQVDLGAQTNPLGLRLRVGGIYNRELGAPAAVGLPSPYLQGGIAMSLTPANTATSVHLEWMQLPFLVLRVQGDLIRYFGLHGLLLEFPDEHAPFGDEAIEALSGRELSRFAGRLLLQPTLQAKIGRFILRSRTDLVWYRFGSGGPYFREAEHDTLLKDGDGLVVNNTMVMARLWSRSADAMLLAGPFYEFQRTFTAGLQRQRLGGAVLFCPAERLGPLARPRLVLQAGFNLQDRNRDGQLFVAGGIGANFDL
jgi:hypothetical protein